MAFVPFVDCSAGSGLQGLRVAMGEKRVKDFYTGTVRKEWNRLNRDAYHRLEFETTLHYLK